MTKPLSGFVAQARVERMLGYSAARRRFTAWVLVTVRCHRLPVHVTLGTLAVANR